MVPLRGPVAKMMGFLGLKGSTPALELSRNRRIPSPMPPMYFLAISSFRGSISVFPVSKSTCSIRLA